MWFSELDLLAFKKEPTSERPVSDNNAHISAWRLQLPANEKSGFCLHEEVPQARQIGYRALLQ